MMWPFRNKKLEEALARIDALEERMEQAEEALEPTPSVIGFVYDSGEDYEPMEVAGE